MGDLKKRQHYVWRHYLRAWASNESIWTYLKDLDKVVRPNLMRIAQEKYFYELVDFSDAEENFLAKFIDENSPTILKDLNFDFLRLFTSTGKLKKQLEDNRNPEVNRDLINSEIKELQVNLMEDGHGKIESLGFKILACRSLEDLKALSNDELQDAIMFLCFQYFRTKNMKSSVLSAFKDGPYEELAMKSWNIISHVMATTLAWNISLDKNLKYTLIENSSVTSFLTSDQPIFNILNDRVDTNGEVTDLEFYYPLTPKFALILHFRADQIELFEKKIAEVELVDRLNKKVFENSHFAVFSDNELVLKEINEW